MIGAIILNLKNDGAIVAGVFLLISLALGYIQDRAANVELFAIYAASELLFIHCIHSIGSTPLIKDMINISRASIAVQLLGATMWLQYYNSSTYVTLCEVVFTVQILRLFWHGFATRKATNICGNTLDNLHTGMVGKKL